MKKRFRTAEDVTSTLTLSVLAVVPVMLTTFERGQRRRRRLMLGLAIATAVVACGAVVAWVILG